eukprot:4831029-Amphidinium_carterae.1
MFEESNVFRSVFIHAATIPKPTENAAKAMRIICCIPHVVQAVISEAVLKQSFWAAPTHQD